MGKETLNGQVTLVRIFLGESDRWHGNELYEAIVMEARKYGISGATVLRGIMSYGANKHFHAAKLLDISTDLPIVVEIVDNEDKVRAFLQTIDPMLAEKGCLITLERVEIYRHQPDQHAPHG